MSPFLKDNKGANLDPWILLFKTILDRQIPEALESPTEDQDEIEKRDKHIIWKTKSVASKTTYRLYSRYGNPKFADTEDEVFSQAFYEKYAVLLLESHLSILLKRKTNFVGSKTLNFALKYVSQSTKLPLTMEKLKPFVDRILYDTLVSPIMLTSHKDIITY